MQLLHRFLNSQLVSLSTVEILNKILFNLQYSFAYLSVRNYHSSAKHFDTLVKYITFWEKFYRFISELIHANTLHWIVLMCDDIRRAKITTKPRFDNEKGKFYHETIPKAVKMKRMPTWKQHEGNESLRKCRANEAWWWILRMWRNCA